MSNTLGLYTQENAASHGIYLISSPQWTGASASTKDDAWMDDVKRQCPQHLDWLKQLNFNGKVGSYAIAPCEGGFDVIVCVSAAHAQAEQLENGRFQDGQKHKSTPTPTKIWALSAVAMKLPKGHYHIVTDITPSSLEQMALGWCLAQYSFDAAMQETKGTHERKLLIESNSLSQLSNKYRAIATVRDMVNLPANIMTPETIVKQAASLAQQYDADIEHVVGDELLTQGYRLIHAVGRASVSPPQLFTAHFKKPKAFKLCIIGKGVSFDSGGLNIKPDRFMRLMKKDMGGAAHAIGLAQLLLDQELNIDITLSIAAVENAISGDSFRPGDIIESKAGLTVEIDNTDAEGRLILADAIAAQAGKDFDLIIDFATLTGAARVAVGAEMAAFFCNNEHIQSALMKFVEPTGETVWPLPLHQEYMSMLESRVADVVNSASSSYGGAITAALFLQKFVERSLPETDWLHFDMMAYNGSDRPGRPVGGEAMGLLTAYEYLLAHAAA